MDYATGDIDHISSLTNFKGVQIELNLALTIYLSRDTHLTLV